MKIITTTFYFRVYLFQSDRPDITVFYYGFEPPRNDYRQRFNEEWIVDSLFEENLYKLFDLDANKSWQVIGKAKITGHYDYFGEYDEDIEILESSSEEFMEEEGNASDNAEITGAVRHRLIRSRR